jgi:hypothetical protein
VNVSVTESSDRRVDLSKDRDGACEHGWQYGATMNEIVLCPDVCEAVKADPGAHLEAILGCKTVGG